MGIYGLEKLPCGCKIKHYIGGKTIQIANRHCKSTIKHRTVSWFQCGVCNKKFNLKKEIKKHQWEHGV